MDALEPHLKRRRGHEPRVPSLGRDTSHHPADCDVWRREHPWPAPVFKGVRTFVLTPRNDGSTDFVMEERFSGVNLPLVKGSMPDFGPVFERYASDLKREAEQAAH